MWTSHGQTAVNEPAEALGPVAAMEHEEAGPSVVLFGGGGGGGGMVESFPWVSGLGHLEGVEAWLWGWARAMSVTSALQPHAFWVPGPAVAIRFSTWTAAELEGQDAGEPPPLAPSPWNRLAE